MIVIAICYLLSLGLFSQNCCDSLHVRHGKIRCAGEKKPFSGYIDCHLYYKDTQKIPNIHRVIFCYTQHAWYSEEYDKIDSVRAVGLIVNGKEDGKWEYYKEKTDTLLVDCYFVRGKLSGPLNVYNKNGAKYTDEFLRGRNKGIYRKYLRKSVN